MDSLPHHEAHKLEWTLESTTESESTEELSTYPTRKGIESIQSENTIIRWFSVPPCDHLLLEPVKVGEQHFDLISKGDNVQMTAEFLGRPCSPFSPWNFIADKVWMDVLRSFARVWSQSMVQKCQNLKPTLVLKLGKNFFQSVSQSATDQVTNTSVLTNRNRWFVKNVPTAYIRKLLEQVIPTLELFSEEIREIYYLKLFDKRRPESKTCCTCLATNGNRIQLSKVSVDHAHHLVIDISCLDKTTDMSLMVCSKRILTVLTDDERQNLTSIIESAILDNKEMSGLKWPEGKSESGDYSVVKIKHAMVQQYKCQSLKLEVKRVVRFELPTSIGEATKEISLKFPRILSELQEPGMGNYILCRVFEEDIRFIWDYLLC